MKALTKKIVDRTECWSEKDQKELVQIMFEVELRRKGANLRFLEVKVTAKTIDLTPITRITMSLSSEMDLDQGKLFNDECHKKYISMLDIAEKKRDASFKSLFLLDALIAVVLSGKNIRIPGTDISTLDLPAVLESLTAAASFAALFASIAFTNAVCYAQIADQFNIRKARASGIDPDFISAADHFFEFILKIFRKKLNIWGIDFYEPGRGFITTSGIIIFMVSMALVSIPLVHIVVMFYSLQSTISSNGWSIAIVGYTAMIFITNAASILLSVVTFLAFRFTLSVPDESSTLVSKAVDEAA